MKKHLSNRRGKTGNRRKGQTKKDIYKTGMIKSINADLDEVKKSGTRQATMEWNDQEAL